MPIHLFDSQGQPVRTTRLLGEGGEGRVYEVDGRQGQAAKVYEDFARDRADKLIWMVRLQTDLLLQLTAWPTSTLHEDRHGGPVKGFLMTRISDHREIHQLYAPKDRKRFFPEVDWRFLAYTAMNCAIVFEALHRQGHLVGDVNQKNVLVANDATVHLIDCDSFQVRATDGRVFRCGVGVPEFTPPELQGSNFRDLDREEHHDRFGLAVLIFHLLFMGRHPFSGRYHGHGEIPLEQAIREGRFAFSRTAHNTPRTEPPPGSPTLEVVPLQLAELFERAFAPSGRYGGRPSATEWKSALDRFRTELQPCRSSRTHLFHPVSDRCPWCELAKRRKVEYFGPPKALAKPLGSLQPGTPKRRPLFTPTLFTGAIIALIVTVFLGILSIQAWRIGSRVLKDWRVDTIVQSLADSVGRKDASDVLGRIGPADAPAVPRLVEWLDDNDSDVRWTAAEALGQIGPAAAPAVPRLVDRLDDKDWRVRQKAAEALGRIDPDWSTSGRAKQAVPRLVERLDDNDSDVRWTAAEALGQIGPAAAPAVPTLVEHLADHYPKARYAAAVTLGQIGPAAAPAVPTLIERLDDKDWDVRRKAGEALGRIGPAAAPAVPTLVERLDDEGGFCEVAVKALGRIDPNWPRSERAKQAVPKLVHRLADKDGVVRRAAAEALGRIDPNWPRSEGAKQAMPELVHRLADKYWVDSREAVEALGRIDPNWPRSEGAKQAVTKLIERLVEDDPDVRQAARMGLEQIDPDWPRSEGAKQGVRKLIELLAAGILTPMRTAEALGQIGPAAAPAVPRLVELLANEWGGVCGAAAEALGRIDPNWPRSEGAKQAVPKLIERLSSPNSDVRRKAAEALGRIDPNWPRSEGAKQAVPMLIERLSNNDSDVRRKAAEALGQIRPTSAPAVPWLVEHLADESHDVCEAAAEALGRIDPNWPRGEGAKQAVPMLIERLAVSNWYVRQAAAEALGQIGPAAVPAVPRLVELVERLDVDSNGYVRQAAADALERIDPPSLRRRNRRE